MAPAPKTPRRDIAALIERAQSGDRRIRPFLRRHRADLLPLLGTRYIDRKLLMLIVLEGGLINEHGRPPTKETAAASWRDVLAEPAGVPRDARRRPPRVAHDVRPPIGEPPPPNPPAPAPQPHLPTWLPEPTAGPSPAIDEGDAAARAGGGPVSQGQRALERLRRETVAPSRPPPPVFNHRQV